MRSQTDRFMIWGKFQFFNQLNGCIGSSLDIILGLNSVVTILTILHTRNYIAQDIILLEATDMNQEENHT